MEWEHSAAASQSPGNTHELKSPVQLAFSSCPAAYPLLQPCSSQCFCHLSGGRGTVHPSSAPWLHVGVCQVGEMGGHPVLLRRAAAAWEHMAGPGIITSAPRCSSAQSTNTANRLSHCTLRTTEHFCCLPLAPFPQALHQLGTPPRNTIFAQTSSRVGTHGRRGAQLFLLSCLRWAQFGSGILQPPVPACQL